MLMCLKTAACMTKGANPGQIVVSLFFGGFFRHVCPTTLRNYGINIDQLAATKPLGSCYRVLRN